MLYKQLDFDQRAVIDLNLLTNNNHMNFPNFFYYSILILMREEI